MEHEGQNFIEDLGRELPDLQLSQEQHSLYQESDFLHQRRDLLLQKILSIETRIYNLKVAIAAKNRDIQRVLDASFANSSNKLPWDLQEISIKQHGDLQCELEQMQSELNDLLRKKEKSLIEMETIDTRLEVLQAILASFLEGFEQEGRQN
jgi:chromosome segregation ATPase